MAQHIKTGKKGEVLALEYIKNKRYKILETNWRYRRSEVDIIAMDQKTLVFIEVKTRSSDYFGKPEIAVTNRKKKLLVDAGTAYMQEVDHTWEIRFDIIAIVLRSENDIEIQHFIDAFFPGLSTE